MGFSPPTKVLFYKTLSGKKRFLIHLIYKHFVLLLGNYLTMRIIIYHSMVNTRGWIVTFWHHGFAIATDIFNKLLHMWFTFVGFDFSGSQCLAWDQPP